MVTIINYALRQSKEGKNFVSLQLQGDLELVQSSETGKFYATARRCFITSTFDEETAKNLIGSKLSGSIVRAECEAYDYAIPESDEVIKLAHTYLYVPEERHEMHVLQSAREKVVLTA
ncbi:MAG TPA: hypothetical protein VFU29_22965 [Chitinophagaceae bacterium]|nr:hypothetical protein [Chitinophagaceae bacterium]